MYSLIISSCKFWETVSDKEYIVDYYKYVIRLPLKIKFNDKEQNTQEVKRIVFNAPSDIKQILNIHAEFIIKFGIFNSVS